MTAHAVLFLLAVSSMSTWASSRRTRIAFAAGAIGVYLVLAIWASFAKEPWSDEGSFASPAYNLAFRGFAGTTIIDEQSSGLIGIHAHTYWNPPLGMLVHALSFKWFGFHLVVMRLPSILMGLVAALSWFVIVRQLTGRTLLPYAVMALMLCDYTFVMSASMARYDMMCAGFGALGLASYLSLRDRSIGLALLVANGALVAAGLSHPLGIVYLLGLAGLVFRDRKRLGPGSLALAAIPYVVGGLAWGLYILEDPQSFVTQFRSNLVGGGRARGLSLDPFVTLWSEIDDRYLRAFGLREHTPGNAGPVYLKAFILCVYFAGAIAALAMRKIRGQPGVRTIAGLFVLVFAFLTFGEGQRGAVYLVHVIPFYACLLALVAADLLARRNAWTWFAAPVLAAFVALQLGGTVTRAAQNTFGRRYAPAMAYVRAHACKDELVVGSVAGVFGVDLDGRFVADNRLGYYSGADPDWIVVDDFLRESFALDRANRPEIARHIDQVLASHVKVFEGDGTEVYRANRPASAHMLRTSAWHVACTSVIE